MSLRASSSSLASSSKPALSPKLDFSPSVDLPCNLEDNASNSSACVGSAPGPFRNARARASSSASSSSTSLRFFPGLLSVGQPAFAQPTKSAGRAESHHMGPPKRPASVDAQEIQPVFTLGPCGPGLLKCNGTRHIAVVPKFVPFLSIACREHKYSYPGFFHLAIRLASPHFSCSNQSYNSL